MEEAAYKPIRGKHQSRLAGQHEQEAGTTPLPDATKTTPSLRYRKTPALLLSLYAPTLIVPWVLMCIMMKRPLGSPSYRNSTGDGYLNDMAGLLSVQLLKTINAVVAVPIISALLAYAAIVYAMRRKHKQSLSLQQLFALADRGWTNPSLLWSARSRGKSSHFLWLGALLIAIGKVSSQYVRTLAHFV